MKRIFLRILTVLLALLIAIPGVADESSAHERGVYDAYAATWFPDITYADLIAMSEEEQAEIAAAFLTDICGHEPEINSIVTTAKSGFSAAYFLAAPDETQTILGVLYAMHDSLWIIACDTTDPTIIYEPLMIGGSPLNLEITLQLLEYNFGSSFVENMDPVDRTMMWRSMAEFTAYMAELYPAPTMEGEGQFGAAEYDPASQWPIEVSINVNMVIEDSMSDFQFRVNDGEPFPATVDRENNVVRGSFKVTKNGTYTVELGYRLSGLEYSQSTEVNVEGIDESILENHEHEFLLAFADEHPHVEMVCICGEKKPYESPLQGPGAGTPFMSTECCECVGHAWESPIFEANGKVRQYCSRIDVCGISKVIEPSAALIADKMVREFESDIALSYTRSDGTQGSLPAWRVYNSYGSQLLRSRGFTWSTDMIDKSSDMLDTAIDTAGKIGEKYILGIDEWEQQKVSMWEDLVVQLLNNRAETEAAYTIPDEFTTITEGGQVVYNFYSNTGNMVKNVSELLKDTWNDKYVDAILFADSMEEVQSAKDKLEEYTALYEGAQEDLAALEKFGHVVNTLNIVGKTVNAANETQQQIDNLMMLLSNYNRNMEILDELSASAQAVGNDELYIAVENIRATMKANAEGEINAFLLTSNAMMETVAKELANKSLEGLVDVGVDLSEEALKKMGLPAAGLTGAAALLGTIEIGAKCLDSILEWDSLCAEAELLNTYQSMTNDLNISLSLGQQNAYHTAELWTLLQIEGAEQAKIFLEAYDDALGFRVEDLDGILRSLDTDISNYESFLSELYSIRAQ